MFLMKFFYFLRGYVIIKVYGNSVWRLVSLCAEKGIRLYNIVGGEHPQFTVMQDDFYEVFCLASVMNVKIKVQREYGLGNVLYKYRKRVGLPIGFAVFVLFFALSNLFLWDIRVETDGELDHGLVLEVLSEIGVKPGVLIKNIPDGRTMKNHLVNSFENVPWAWVYVDGIRATVHIHEGKVPPVMVDEDEPCDIIAAKDGFITQMSVKEGAAAVMPGNGVNAGELLISGLVERGPEDAKVTYTVHADGEVMALTRYEKTQEYSLWENRPEFTGREKNVYDITLFSKKFSLFSAPDYSYCITTENNVFSLWGFSLKKSKYMEAEKNKIQLPKEWVIEFAKRDLSAQIAAELGKSATLQSEEYTVTENANSVTVTLEMEFIEDIGVTVPG